MKHLHKIGLIQLIPLVLVVIGVSCTAGEKAVAKTALDVAGDACRFEFGAKPSELPPGISLEDFCKAEEHLQPFVDHLLSAREGLARKLGTARPAADAGAD